jgi:N-methylhydantoinase A/oxoprolinase/acetone carboxylase beta subunit
MNYRLGIDVGGTNTDAVIVDEQLQIIASVKTHTTRDVTTGINQAITRVLEDAKIDRKAIKYAMLGTTHCTNAIVERSDKLLKVGVVRIGKPATLSIPPMVDWPDDIVKAVGGQVHYVTGGHEFDGQEIFPLDEEELRSVLRNMAGKVDSLAIISVFSPVDRSHEERAAAIAREIMPGIQMTLSSEIASIGLLERENAAILNASLYEVARTTAQGFRDALAEAGVTDALMYLCQNDGTLMSIDYAMQYPILTIACGPTNSIRGASFLSRRENAIVLDIGGTTSDIGIVQQGFPRESSLAVEIGGVRTNFRMPDIISIGLGGGSVVREEDGQIRVGPDSVGYRIVEEAMVFGGSTLTATDIAVRLGLADIGDKTKVAGIDQAFAERAHRVIMDMINEYIDRMKISRDPMPLIVVGGGSILAGGEVEGVSEVVKPVQSGVANALGAAVALVSGQVDEVFSFENISRDEAVAQAKETAAANAVKAGAERSTVEIVEVDVIPLAYLGNAARIRVKATGNLPGVNAGAQPG